MENFIDLSDIIANKSERSLVVLSVNLPSQEDAVLERKLRELKAKQELRKDWILFIVRDVVIFPTTILFILVISGYSLFTLIKNKIFWKLLIYISLEGSQSLTYFSIAFAHIK